ncbi:MAG: ABC transporter substrate-binding protein, partial [Myxococcota bacterium]|nr:ABC transporter substrate-binding protein [Myxococcota bacterium]
MSPVAIVAFILAACSGGPSSMPAAERSGLTSVKVALNWFPEPEFGGFYEGVLGGHYTAVGLDVEIIPGGPSAPTLELLGSGRAQVALTAADDLLLKRTKGIRAVGAWPGFQLNPLGLMVHEGSGPADFAAIASMTDPQVAIEVGGPFQTFLWKRHGWEGVVQAVPYGGSVGPFLADPGFIQQAYVTSEPCVARARGAAVRFLKASDAGWNHYGSLVAFADPPPPWAARFVAATQQAWTAYLEQPARANAEIARLNDQMTPGLLDCVTEAQRPFVLGQEGLGAMRDERWEATAA